MTEDTFVNMGSNVLKIITDQCSRLAESTKSHWLKESDHHNRYSSTSMSSIISTVLNQVKDKFWEDVGVNKPLLNNNKFPKLFEKSHALAQLLVWSCFEQSAFTNIIECLTYGNENWTMSKNVGPLEWILAFVTSIRLSVHYSCLKYAASNDLGSSNDNTEDITTIEMCCVTMAVAHSASLFRIINEHSPMKLVIRYVEYLTSDPTKHAKLIHTKVPELQKFGIEESRTAIVYSILVWYQHFTIMPLVYQLLKLPEVKEILIAINTVLRDRSGTPWSDVCNAQLQPKAVSALSLWDIQNTTVIQQYQLILFVSFAYDLTRIHNPRKIPSYGEQCVMKIFSIGKCGEISNVKDIAKKVVALDPVYFVHFFIQEVAGSSAKRRFHIPPDDVWEIYFPRVSFNITTQSMSGVKPSTDNHKTPSAGNKSPGMINQKKRKSSSLKSLPKNASEGNVGVANEKVRSIEKRNEPDGNEVVVEDISAEIQNGHFS